MHNKYQQKLAFVVQPGAANLTPWWLLYGVLALTLITGCAWATTTSNKAAGGQGKISELAGATGSATLTFTATQLDRDYRGEHLGTGSLRLYAPGGQCEMPPKALAGTQRVNADQRSVLLTIPAGQPLVLASFWSAGGAHCVVGNYNFTAEPGASYKLTNVQSRATGLCKLRLQRLAEDGSRYLEDYSLQRNNRACSAIRAMR